MLRIVVVVLVAGDGMAARVVASDGMAVKGGE